MPDDIRRTPGDPEDAGDPARVEEDPWAPVKRGPSPQEPPSGASPPSYEEPVKRTLEYGPDEQPTIVNTPGVTEASPPEAASPAGSRPSPGGWGAPGGSVPPPPPAPPDHGPDPYAPPVFGGYTAPSPPLGGPEFAGPAGPPIPPGPGLPRHPGHPGYAGYQGSPGIGGHPGYGYGYGWPGGGVPTQNGMGTAALVLGIVSVCLFFLYGVVSLILGTLAVVFGVKGRRHADRGEATNRGQAQAGLVTGIVGIILGVIVLLVLAGAKANGGAGASHLTRGGTAHGPAGAPRAVQTAPPG